MKTFPPGFLWGSATSSHQVEGDNNLNDWWDWELAGKPAEPSGKACDSWVRFEEDFEIARSLNLNAHRFSIEWSRVEPEEGKWDETALARYRDMVHALRARRIEPIVTLHHFTNPRWLAAKGDWENPIVVGLFERFARKTAEAIGADVRYWVTINEPMVFVYHGYVGKFWPPGKSTPGGVGKVVRHMAHAHCKAYDAIHALYTERKWPKPVVGLAHAMQIYEPARDDWRDRLSVRIRTALNNRLFLRLIHHDASYWPARLFGLGGTVKKLDFLGLNYYFREIIQAGKRPWTLMGFCGDVCRNDDRYRKAEKSDLEWEIYPEGIYRILKDLKAYGLPVIVTENGICTTNEDVRRRFIRDHLAQVHRAIEEGVPVIGYQYWSLLDNFEWSFGFKPRFGLVHVDFSSQKRTVKDSARWYAEVCRRNSLD